MTHEEDQGWKFGAKANHLLDWGEGHEGKGILFEDRSLHTWVDEGATHFEHMEEHPEAGNGLVYLYIKPDGGM